MIKKLILLGFGLTLLIGLPLALFVLQNQNQTTTQSGAAPQTKFSFSGPTSVASNASFDEQLVVDPGSNNQVSFVKFNFTFDQTKINAGSTLYSIDQSKYTLLENPTSTCSNNICTVTGTLSIGSNQTAVIKSPTPIATFHFTAVGDTDSNGTQLAFSTDKTQNQALSVGSSDQAAENVFSNGIPETIIIGSNGSANNGGSPTATPTPTGTNNSGTGNGTGTNTGGNGGTGNTGGTGTTGGTANNNTVTCTSFTATPTSGNPPLTVTFTTVGSSTNDTISRIDITYGDGSTDTVASGSGIGSGNVQNQIFHTYSGNGSFTANAVLTTTSGATSTATSCQQTITVGQAVATTGNKLPPTGPGETFMIIGAAGALLTIAGLAVVAGL